MSPRSFFGSRWPRWSAISRLRLLRDRRLCVDDELLLRREELGKKVPRVGNGGTGTAGELVAEGNLGSMRVWEDSAQRGDKNNLRNKT